jgi:Flp pilus assembly protein TadG
MVLTVLCMAVLLGFVAFAVDVGMLLRAKGVMQTAADSASIAGAAELNYGDFVAAAQLDASQNGVTDGTNGAVVTVNNGPQSGPFAGNPNYVEVIVSEPQPTFFMRMFNQNSVTVSARSVSTLVSTTTCIYALGQTQGAGGVVSNGGTLSAPTCGILDNNTLANGISAQSGGSIIAKSIGVVGGVDTSGGGSITPTPITGTAPVNDPLSYLTPPQPSACTSGNITISASTTLDPAATGGIACYNGTITIVNNATVTLLPGTYVFNNQIDMQSATLTGTGVTLYFANSAGLIAFLSTLSLTAPVGGAYSGVLFYEDPSDPAPLVLVDVAGALNGVLYAPSAQISVTNNGGTIDISNTTVVANSLSTTGNVNIQGYAPAAGLSPPVLTERLAE